MFIQFPSNLDWSEIKELQITPRKGYFDAIWVSKDNLEGTKLNRDNVLSIEIKIVEIATLFS